MGFGCVNSQYFWKVRTEVGLKLEEVAAACSKAEEMEEDNKAVLEKARRVEEEVNDTADVRKSEVGIPRPPGSRTMFYIFVVLDEGERSLDAPTSMPNVHRNACEDT